MAGKLVRVVSPTGQRGTIPEENLMSAISEGFTPEEEHEEKARLSSLQDDYGTLGQQAITAAEGLSRGLSLGTSDAATATLAGLTGKAMYDGPQLTPEAQARAEQMGLNVPSAFDRAYDETRAAQDARQEANPITAVGSELVGALAPAAFTGGTSAVARGLAATPAALAGRAGEAVAGRLAGATPGLLRAGLAGAAGGATEGAIAGGMLGGTRLTTEQMTDPGEAAEGLVAAISAGALLGGLVGGASSTIGRGLQRGAGKLDELATMKVRPDEVIDIGPSPDFEGITINLEARPLTSAQLPDPQRGKWKTLADRARAAQGGFDEAVSDGTASLRGDVDLIQREMSHIDEFAGIAAKRRANELNIGHPVGLQEIDGVLGQMNGQLDAFQARYSQAALAPDGGLNAIERVRNIFAEERPFLEAAARSGDVGELYGRLDNLKRSVGRARGTKSASVQDLMESVYKPIQGFLEDESIWGELAVRQRGANAAWSNRISAGKDARLRQFYSDAGGNANRAANEWDQLRLANSGSLQSLLGKVGDNGIADVEEAFRRNLRATARDATERAKAWGTPDLQQRAVVITNAAKRIEDRMDSVALLRRDKLAHEASLKGSTIEMLGQLAAGFAPNPLSAAINVTVGAKRKLTQLLGVASTAESRAAVQSAMPPKTQLEQTVGHMREGVATHIARSAATLLHAASAGARTAAAGVPVASGVAVGQMLSEKRHDEVVQEALALSNPASPETQALIQQAAELERESPALADAYATQTLRRANYIASQLPQSTDEGSLAPPPALHPITERKMRRTVAAAYDPAAAIERVSQMRGSQEDVDTVRTLFPSMYRAYQAEVQAGLNGLKDRPSYEMRLRIAYATGLPIESTLRPSELQMQQKLARGPDQQAMVESAAEQNRAEGAGFTPGRMREPDEVYSAPVDARLDRR